MRPNSFSINIRSLLTHALLLSPFLSAFIIVSTHYFDFRLPYFIISVVAVMVFFSKGTLFLPRSFLLAFLILTTTSAINLLLGNTTFGLMIPQVIGILAVSTAWYSLMVYNRYNIRGVYQGYLVFATLAAGVGIGEEIYHLGAFFFNSQGLPEELVRVSSVLPEPAHFGTLMLPAFYVAISSFGSKKPILSRLQGSIIILATILTFSVTAYFGMAVAFFLYLIQVPTSKVSKFVILIFIILIFLLVLFNTSALRNRVEDSIGVILGRVAISEVNLSTYTWVSNAMVAFNSLSRNPLFASGLGSHPISYRQFMPSKTWGRDISLNAEDANSLLLRLLSETGLIGFGFVMYFFARNYLRKSKGKRMNVIINHACLPFFAAQMLRSGHYFLEGIFLFFWLYYFSYRLGARRQETIRTS